MLIAGVNNDGKFEVVLTYVLIFVANLLYLLPKGVFPELVEVYDALVRSLFTTIVIWLANKGISWKAESQVKE